MMRKLVLGFLLFAATGCKGSGIVKVQSYDTGIGDIDCVAFSKQGTRVIAAGYQGAFVFDAETGKGLAAFQPNLTERGEQRNQVWSCAAADSVPLVFLGGLWGHIYVWNYETKEVVAKLPTGNALVGAMDCSADGKILAAAVSHVAEELENRFVIIVFDVDSGKTTRRIIGHVGPVTALRFSPKRDRMLSRSKDQTVRFWNVKSGEQLHKQWPEVSSKYVYVSNRCELSFNDAGDSTLIGMSLWNAKTWEKVRQYGDGRAVVTQIVPGDQFVVSGHIDGRLRYWDYATGEQLGEVVAFRNTADVECLAVSPDGSHVLTGGSGSVPGFDALAHGVRAQEKTKVRLWRLPKQE